MKKETSSMSKDELRALLGTREPLPPSVNFSFQFHAIWGKIAKIIGLHLHFGVSTPSGNPRSATNDKECYTEER